MTKGPVLIVGAGHAGFQLAASLRQHGFGERIGLINDEAHLPYQRPPVDTSNAPSFVWPVSGEIVSNFGGPANGERNDGINIATATATPIHAAASGTITYSGNELKDYGNLVLIKHVGGWVTAYAHLASIEVKMRQQVTQGQEIGLVGQSGGVDRPQLHFEIRYAPTPKDKARPIDPMLVLPVK